MASKPNQKWLNYYVSISAVNDHLVTSFIRIFNYHVLTVMFVYKASQGKVVSAD